MKNRKTELIQIVFFFICLMFVSELKAQDVENNYKTRTSVELSFKPIKNFKLNFIPELRFDENFSLDKYLFDAEVVYKPIKFLSFDASYRLGGNIRDNKDTEYFNRFAISATASKKFDRFEPSFRLRYSNDADDDLVNENFLRYKLLLNYDIQNSKLTPFVGVEAFHELADAEIYKMRYIAGLDYKLFKNNYLGLNYKFDYFLKEYKNNHIVSLGYKIKF